MTRLLTTKALLRPRSAVYTPVTRDRNGSQTDDLGLVTDINVHFAKDQW